MIPFPGEWAALFTSVMWTGSSLFFAAATVRVGSVYVNVTRLITAATILALIVLVYQLPLDVSFSQFGYLFVSGLVGLVFGDTFLFKAYEYNGARISSLVMSAAPALTALFAYLLLHETLGLWSLVGMAVTLAGIAVVVLERPDGSSSVMPFSGVGIAFAFLGAAGQAGGLILAKGAFVQGPINGFVATLVRMIAAVSVIVPLSRLAGRYRRPVHTFRSDTRAFMLTMAGAVLGPVLGVTFSFIAISNTDVAVAATLMATSPILMLPVVRVILRERLSWRAVAGACVAVGGVAILFLR
jgi:drug/metabolite transporter (DMT)-like permease